MTSTDFMMSIKTHATGATQAFSNSIFSNFQINKLCQKHWSLAVAAQKAHLQ